MSKWSEHIVEELMGVIGEDTSVEVALGTIDGLVSTLSEFGDFSDRSIAAKVRNLGFSVEKVGKKAPTFTEDQETELYDFALANSGVYTYGEIAAALFDGQMSTRQIQGKLLSMELTEHVKPTEKKEVAKKYSDEEEATFIKLANSGAFIEDIAEALGKSINSIRGKALSLNRRDGMEIPKTRDHVEPKVDPLTALGDVSGLTVLDIATAIDKTERGVKTMLTKRGITAADYDGAAKHAKAQAKKEDS